jgi:hypothetical protein
LQSIVNNAANTGLLKHPAGDNFGGDYPIVQYDDTALIILPAEEDQLLCLKGLLFCFANSTGLKVNFSKSSLLPINLSPERAAVLASAIGCVVGSMPFTYLGLPLGTTKPSVEEFFPILNKN